MVKKQTTFTELTLKGLLLFSVFTVVQGISFFDSINRIWLIFVSIALLGRLMSYRYSVTELFVLVVTLALHVIAVCFTEFPLYHTNMLFYFFLWVLLYLFFAKSREKVLRVLESSKSYISLILWLWTILVGISAFLPSCYKENYFVSFSGNSFRLMPSALIITALAMLRDMQSKDRRYCLFLILPTYAAFMNQSRTYFGIYLLFILMFLYMRTKSRRNFYLLIGPVAAVVVLLALGTGISDKFADVWQESDTFEAFLASFTNARTVFWKWDLEAFFSLPFWQQFVGNGFNFSYDVTMQHQGGAIWAHNDIINILMNFGYIGTAIYIWAYFKLSKTYFRNLPGVPRAVKFLFHGAIFFNSMFNMSYTYFCAVIAYPLFACVITNKYAPLCASKNEQNGR